jgi:hypothetical protein
MVMKNFDRFPHKPQTIGGGGGDTIELQAPLKSIKIKPEDEINIMDLVPEDKIKVVYLDEQ